MGIRGAKPTPTSLRLVTGNRAKRPLRPLVEQPERREIVCPASVAADERASLYWQLAVREASHLGPIDGPLLAVYCKTLSRADAAQQQLGNEFLVRRRGGMARNPLAMILHQAIETARKLSADLALTPPERARLNVREPAPADPAEKFFND